MQRVSSARLVRLPALLATLFLVLGACGGGDARPQATGSGVRATLDASGATFPQAFYEEVIAAFSEVEPGVTINYGGGGSGKGRQELQDRVVDFAGSDGIVKPEDLPKFKGEFLYVPTITAPITVSYNLPDVDELRLDADTLAKIFQRRIKVWDHPAIQKLNPNAELPSTDISVVHRSDGSGTTENFTKYLTAAAPGTWTLGSGSTVEWPADTQAGNGNSGVASAIQSTEGAVGYLDLSDARATDLQVALLKNAAGRFVAPTVEATSAALEGVRLAEDLTYNPLNAAGEDAYPIAAPTWILVYKDQTDEVKARALESFLRFLLTDAQGFAEEIDYAPLPKPMRDQALSRLDALSPA